MKRSAPQSLNVVPTTGGWMVRSGQANATAVHSTQAEAVRAAQGMVRSSGGQLAVHGADGRIKKTFTLGRKAMEKINAVEGVVLSPAARNAFAKFDKDDLSPQQRRDGLRGALVKKAKS